MTSDMLNLTRQELEKRDAFNPQLNPITQQLINAIPFSTVPDKMKYVLVTSQLINFSAQFKRNIKLWDDTLVPINAISFVIAPSGGGKDSSVRAGRKPFADGFKRIETARYQKAVKAAIEAARAAGEDPPNEPAVYEPYMLPIPPIDITPTTGPGLVKHVNDIAALELSSGFIYSGEFADELQSNPDMLENIKTLAEIYDLGIKEVKYTKAAEFRSDAINGEPVSALFVGSPGYILYDEATKKKFHIAFMSKLARRSWFCYTPDKIPEPVFDSIEELMQYEEQIVNQSLQARASVSPTIDAVAKFGIDSAGQDILVSEEAAHLFRVYKRYNNDLVDSLPNQDSTYALIRRHLQWKCLKLAGAYAIMEKSNIITERHFLEAIRFAEIFDKDMEQFEAELNKADHERFSDFANTQLNSEGKAIISIHDIKKKGFLASVSRTKLQELITLCSGYDRDGIYSIINEGGAIQYERIIKTDILTASFKPIDCSNLNRAVQSKNPDQVHQAKKTIAHSAVYGYETEEVTFDQLHELLIGEFAYSPFKFKNGTRGKDNILGGTKWLVLDIDDTPISAEYCHFYLSDINHYVVLTSDPENQYKYRVIIELDSYVELSNTAWKTFYKLVAQDLALKVDLLPQSQIFYSYGDRPIYSNLEAAPLEVREYVIKALETPETTTSVTSSQAKSLLADPLTTFSYAFDAPYGSASRNVIQAIYHLRDLGGDLQSALQLFEDIQDYWEDPFNETRAETMRNQIKGIFTNT